MGCVLVELVEVRVEEPFVGVPGPRRQPVDLAGAERGDLTVHIEAGTLGCGCREPEPDEPLEGVHEAAVLAHTGTEPQRLG